MSATIKLSSGRHEQTVVVSRVLRWSVTVSGSGNRWTRIIMNDGAPFDIEGDHDRALTAALDATMSKVDEDVELIASLQKRVEVLEERVLKPEAVANGGSHGT